MSDATPEWARTLAPNPVCSLALAAVLGIAYLAAIGTLAFIAAGWRGAVAVVATSLFLFIAAWRWSR